ncbi:uncharacterized protein MAM_04423 [Metarhizium album ARSEF 1941]|uniref:HNH nuclease domain-containing protein n=1 Tax=Metarhizium album (strain ARSEF 1941) TaxID=1081103 RepID=A0A0B2WTN2_METAS|nr:uncharacterized protein MAM_04423 [Metarhizium album ARSEF 1941]KHN97408.1 hypothetical protein MAM_04423 [Metarhizium album ARSEF 1941]
MFSLPRLDEVGPQDKTDDETDDSQKGACLGKARYGVHFETMLLACQIIAGNSFETAYLSYDRKGSNRVQLPPCGILMHDHYFLHVPQEDDTDTTSYAITPNFQEWRFPNALPQSWGSVAVTPRDTKPSCIISGRMRPEKAHVIPQSHDKWYTDNAMCDYSQGAKSVSNSDDNVCRLRVDLHRIFDDRVFAFVPKLDEEGHHHTVVHFFSTTNDSGDAALKYHNRKAHSLDSVAPQFLFARFALTVFACIKDFILRGERRQIAVVHRGIDSNGSPAWITREVQMDRAQRHSRYGGGGSRASSPSKRSRPQSESQQGDSQESVQEFRYASEDPENSDNNGDYTSRTRAWVEANVADYDLAAPSKRRRISEVESPPSLTSSASSQVTVNKQKVADKAASSSPNGTSISLKGSENNRGHFLLEAVEIVNNCYPPIFY